MRWSGGVTKGLDTLQELVDYIYTEFGSTWQDHILAKEVGQRRMRIPTQCPIRETRAISDEEVVCNEDVTIPSIPQVVTTASGSITSRVRRWAGTSNCLYEALGYILGESQSQVRQSIWHAIIIPPTLFSKFLSSIFHFPTPFSLIFLSHFLFFSFVIFINLYFCCLNSLFFVCGVGLMMVFYRRWYHDKKTSPRQYLLGQACKLSANYLVHLH